MSTQKILIFAVLSLAGIFLVFQMLAIHQQHAPIFEQVADATYLMSVGNHNSLTTRILEFVNLAPESEWKNYCLNHKKADTMSTKEQLLEFIQGPCLPVVLVPGLVGTKLTVQIDCETLRSEGPEIFSSCGWNTCSEWGWWGSSPLPEYNLWLTDVTSPVHFMWGTPRKCWGNLIQLNYKKDEPDIKMRYQSPAGVKVKIHKQGEEDEQCGFAAQNNLMDALIEPPVSKAFAVLKDALVTMGYQVGLTLYGAPYDWRKTTLASGIVESLNDTVHQAHDLTGKPTILVAHSMGNIGTLTFLNSLTVEEKEKYVANYVSLANALNGSPKSVWAYVGGNNDFFWLNKFGIDLEGQKKMFKGNAGGIDVLLQDPFTQFKDEEWLKQWKLRMDIENGKTEADYPYKWFPTPDEKCFSGFNNRPDQSGMHAYDWSSEPVITIKNESFTASEADIRELFDKYVNIIDDIPELFEDSKTNGVHLLKNPGVPTTVVYVSHLATAKSYTWDYDPRPLTEKNSFAPPSKIEYASGDGVVTAAAALAPAFKWSWEFDNKDGKEKVHPVKTVEICSSYNNKKTIYDKINQSEAYQILENEYIGLECDCMPKGEGKLRYGVTCDHIGAIGDPVLVNFIQTIVDANVRNNDYKNTRAYLLSESQLERVAMRCPLVGTGLKPYLDLIAETIQG